MNVATATAETTAAAEAITTSLLQQYLWCLRREFWEHRAVYLAPAGAAALFLVGFLVSLPAHLRPMAEVDASKLHATLAFPYDMAGGLAMLVTMLVGIFYTLDALYGERRDRTVLFWKSMPVSDLTTVLAKATIPIVILPLLAFGIIFVLQLIMAGVTLVALAIAGDDVSFFWRHLMFFRMSGLLLYHMVTGHALWSAPVYGWLLLISAWAKRTPLIWAFVPPIALCYIEKITFGTTHLLSYLNYRLVGAGMEAIYVKGSMPMNPMTHLTPLRFLLAPGLWDGLLFTGVCIYVAAWFRRHRDPA